MCSKLRPQSLLFAGWICIVASRVFAAVDEPDGHAAISQSASDALTADDILERMAHVYATCHTYRDSGFLKTEMRSGKHEKSTLYTTFSMAFVRPDRFRLEFYGGKGPAKNHLYIVWRNGDDVRTWWDVGRREEHGKQFGLAIAGATGVEASIAYTVPALLMTDEVGPGVNASLKNRQRLDDGIVKGSLCYRIRGEFFGRTTLWIEKKRFVLRRVVEERTVPDASFVHTTHFDPRLDEAIANDALEFAAPSKGAEAVVAEKMPTTMPTVDTLTAREILDRMGRTYAECLTYSDSGKIRSVFRPKNNSPYTESLVFSTAFIRPGRFRFEYSEGESGERNDRYIIWRRAANVRRWWALDAKVITNLSLDQALGAACGVSKRASYIMPSLLMPKEINGFRLTNLKSPTRLEDAADGDNPCCRVAGGFGSSDMTVWIDRERYVVRQIEERTAFPDFTVQETMTFQPVFDEPVDEKLLRFDPPGHAAGGE